MAFTKVVAIAVLAVVCFASVDATFTCDSASRVNIPKENEGCTKFCAAKFYESDWDSYLNCFKCCDWVPPPPDPCKEQPCHPKAKCQQTGPETRTCTCRGPTYHGDGLECELSSGLQRSFAYTGGEQAYTVPMGASKVKVKGWGAGGGAGYKGDNGGGGGYVETILDVYEGEKLLVRVGGPGKAWVGPGASCAIGNSCGGGAGGYNGGGRGGAALKQDGKNLWDGAGGGGMSSIQRGAKYLFIAPGGGGGGSADSHASGGAGGGLGPGRNGASSLHAGGGRGGGTQKGGAGGTARGAKADYVGGAGAAYKGGDAKTANNQQFYDEAGGGGGAGWRGGGAGGAGLDGAGGGGGSGYAAGKASKGAAGSGRVPGNSKDGTRPGSVGYGGTGTSGVSGGRNDAGPGFVFFEIVE
eukprot:TRINITY_DN1749_c0_g1_i2.p1 TRINITY_DN1749_c0_g1~~TRINITY_DN1749_c0_g1_i2.p1  ORF type:complete len:411 (+),score=150.03 TRINITY_DN1749_c0_g1_i2:148-1380(+)